MIAHDTALVEKAAQVLCSNANYHPTRHASDLPCWCSVYEAIAVLDLVADDLREQGRAEVRAAVEPVLRRSPGGFRSVAIVDVLTALGLPSNEQRATEDATCPHGRHFGGFYCEDCIERGWRQ